MPHRIMHPTKEQVRAYMAARESARRPPPSPEEIRRQLGWRLESGESIHRLLQIYQITTTYTQMSTRLALVWMCASLASPVCTGDSHKNYL